MGTNVTIEYRTNSNENWQTASGNSVTITNLTAGLLTLEVRAKDSVGNLSSVEQRPVEVKQAPSETAEEFAWSKLISPATIEDLIKAQVAPLKEQTKTPRVFKSGGNHHARLNFSMVAMLFAVIQQFDGDVRWKKDAADR